MKTRIKPHATEARKVVLSRRLWLTYSGTKSCAYVCRFLSCFRYPERVRTLCLSSTLALPCPSSKFCSLSIFHTLSIQELMGHEAGEHANGLVEELLRTSRQPNPQPSRSDKIATQEERSSEKSLTFEVLKLRGSRRNVDSMTCRSFIPESPTIIDFPKS